MEIAVRATRPSATWGFKRLRAGGTYANPVSGRHRRRVEGWLSVFLLASSGSIVSIRVDTRFHDVARPSVANDGAG